MALMEGVFLSFPVTFVAGASIAANTTVKLDTAGKVVNTGAGDVPYGWVDRAYSSGDLVTVLDLNGTALLTAGGVTAIGDYIKCGASGKFVVEATATTPTVFTFGQSLAVTADTNVVVTAVKK